MRKIILSALSIWLLSACNDHNSIKNKTISQDSLFNHYKNYFVDELWKIYPEWASSVGYHNYDSCLTIYDEKQKKTEIDFLNAQLDSLKKYDPASLEASNQTDYDLIQNQLKSALFNALELKSEVWNPSVYNIGGTCAELLAGNFGPLNNRVKSICQKLRYASEYYEAARMNIKNPTIEHTQLAIQQIEGAASIFETDLIDSIKKTSFSEAEKKSMLELSYNACKNMKDFVSWLKALKNEHPRSFRLGKEMYAKKFDFDMQAGSTFDQMLGKALTRKKEVQSEMIAISRTLWPKYFKNESMPKEDLSLVRKMIDKLSEKHVSRDSFQLAIESQIPTLIDFIKEKNLITVDPSKPLVVRKEPAYMQGVAGASISAPGPYDKNGNTYYNVGSLASYTADAAESYLREYNHYILQILNIHEAIPGHYTQLIYSNQSPSLIKSLFGNNSMIEGWAVYTERMMLENGYGGGTPEFWLMYYKWHLRSVCNTILDISVHTQNMKKEEAIKLLQDEAFQQKAEAENKWRRVSVTQVQLCCYFTGYSEIYDLREELKKKEGSDFDLKKFHETFLSFGSAPVKNIRSLMLTNNK